MQIRVLRIKNSFDILRKGICEEFASLAVKLNCSQMPSKKPPFGGFFDSNHSLGLRYVKAFHLFYCYPKMELNLERIFPLLQLVLQ